MIARRALLLLALAGCAAPAGQPLPFEARGRIVCLLDEMKRAHQADAAPVHEHAWGFRAEEQVRGVRHFTLLRTPRSEALFTDGRFRERELRLTGRLFPETAIVELGRFQAYRDGVLHDVYYWCGICSIRGVDPGPCMCCQDPVELREAPSVSP